MSKTESTKRTRPPKIVVVGSRGHPRDVKSYDWLEVARVPNIADQDGVILDMTTLTEEVLKSIARKKLSYFTVPYFLSLLTSGGKVFAIAMPPKQVARGTYVGATQYFGNFWWNPFSLKITEEQGDTVGHIDERFLRYFECLRAWSFTVTVDVDRQLKLLQRLAEDIGSSPVKALAKNRYGKSLGIQIQTSQDNDSGFYFLPPPTEISSKAAVDLILEDFFGVKTSESEEPDWVRHIRVPGESEIEDRIHKGLARIQKEQTRIEKERRKQRQVRKFTRLLYTEDDELEGIVRETLSVLGAKVTEPKEKGKEDGWIETKLGKVVLEIKKAAKSASKDDVRQLDEWVGNCLKEGEECKGMLIINHYGDKPLKERKKPFPDNVRKYAKDARREPFCLLTTVELFNAFCAFKEGKISADQILKKMFEADGEECKLV